MENVTISINYRGNDIQCEVDLETANLLLNDPEAAEEFLLRNNLVYPNFDTVHDERDNEATLFMLDLQAQYGTKFDDRKTAKLGLWQNIAHQMKEAGFMIEEGKNGAEKCRQKFANLQKSYMNHLSSMRRTGEESKQPPPFFEKLHDIFKNKHKANPAHLEDSLSGQSTSSTTCTTNEDPDIENTPPAKKACIVNKFQSSSTLRQSNQVSNAAKILEVMERDKKDGNEQAEAIIQALRIQNEQRERMLELFALSVGVNKKPN